MMQKRTKWRAILDAKCPRCREGDMFPYPTYRLDKLTMIHHKCPKCDLRYEVEPGFFYGAMYISYAFSVAIMISLGVATYIIGKDPDAWVYLWVVSVGLALAVPFSFRYSRVLMLHWFGGVRYKESLKH
jgi:uncharacterized protein (DUF983 family)